MPTRIDWCDESINPLGHWCFGPGGTKDNPKPCAYCYAKKMAARGMYCEKCKSFAKPHTHFEQLEKLAKWKRPKTIFIQSMGDLFHDEVPDEWIQEVFRACEVAPQHRYLFLTKNPKRYKCNILHAMLNQYHKVYIHNLYIPPEETFGLHVLRKKADSYEYPKNMYFGTTITRQYDANRRNYGLSSQMQGFLSLEPLQEKITLEFDEKERIFIKWVIVGAETGNRKDKITPKREWIENIVQACRGAGVPVFLKNNLADIWQEPLIQQFPWEG